VKAKSATEPRLIRARMTAILSPVRPEARELAVPVLFLSRNSGKSHSTISTPTFYFQSARSHKLYLKMPSLMSRSRTLIDKQTFFVITLINQNTMPSPHPIPDSKLTLNQRGNMT